MRIRGDLKPHSKFTIEPQPNNEGFYLARFFENIVPIKEETEMGVWEGYEYDEYTLELFDTGNLQEDIENNFESYLMSAKKGKPPIIEPRVENLESTTDELLLLFDIQHGLEG